MRITAWPLCDGLNIVNSLNLPFILLKSRHLSDNVPNPNRKTRVMCTMSSKSRIADSPLPPAGCKSWSAHKKAAVVIAIRTGGLSRQEAYERYMLSSDELMAWEAAFALDGIAGLQSRRLPPARSA